MRFFKPDRQLINSIIEYAGDRIIVDVGCGIEANLIQDLLTEGATKLIGIDMFLDYSKVYPKCKSINLSASYHLMTGEVTIHEKLLCQLGDKALFLLCRPCHHPLLIQETIRIALTGGSEILYIGKEENVEADLSGEEYEYIQLTGTSQDNEVIIKIKQTL